MSPIYDLTRQQVESKLTELQGKFDKLAAVHEATVAALDIALMLLNASNVEFHAVVLDEQRANMATYSNRRGKPS